jgi:phenylacetate-coenzyme A ligase PaaK-like adenylate-forming protein
MGISIVLARMGEQFEQQSATSKPSKDLLYPPTLWRMLKALIISKLKNRPILPKDMWKLKGIMSGGTDTEIYKDKIEYYWGKKPLEGFACTEAGNMAMQSWNYKGMTFFPDNAFLEFIPLEETNKEKNNPEYQVKTVLYDELEVGVYELVFSSFHGGVLVRYRIGDLFEVISVGDKEIGTELPQLIFYSRADDVIDLGGFVRLTERDIWKTIHATGIDYQDWVARKESKDSLIKLHIYIEPKGDLTLTEENICLKLDELFSNRFSEYIDLKEMLVANPLTVTILPEGSFDGYMKMKMAAGADLAHLKPPHMQPSDEILKDLFSIRDE